MLVDSRELPDHGKVQADVCIVGSGAAAIPLALELIDTRLRVVVLESGGQTAESGGRGIYQIVGGAPPRLVLDSSRPGFLGGNTNYWNGNCRPLDEVDFEPREWIPHSGWPIRKPQLARHYERAQAICGLGDLRWYDLNACLPHLEHPPLDVDAALLTKKILQTCPVPSFADLHRQRLEAAQNLRIYLHARALRLQTNVAGDRVCSVEAIGPNGNRLQVEAGTFVLAAGGIDNARLLLCSNDVHRNGLANENDLVGRFFMEHWTLEFPIGRYGDTHDLIFHGGRQSVDGTRVWGQLVVSEEFMRSERVPGFGLTFYNNLLAAKDLASGGGLASQLKQARPKQRVTDLRLALIDPGDAARRVLRKLNPQSKQDGYRLRVQLEQTPNRENRIRLSTERDPLGQPKAEIILRLTDAERHGYAKALQMAGDQLGLNGRRLRRQMSVMLNAGRFYFFWHHMGTTRMHDDPAHGVVDADCRVHGVPNLFVAGCSVFPTGGTAPPTLTIVALAVRLADHIRRTSGLTVGEHADAGILEATP